MARPHWRPSSSTHFLSASRLSHPCTNRCSLLLQRTRCLASCAFKVFEHLICARTATRPFAGRFVPAPWPSASWTPCASATMSTPLPFIDIKRRLTPAGSKPPVSRDACGTYSQTMVPCLLLGRHWHCARQNSFSPSFQSARRQSRCHSSICQC